MNKSSGFFKHLLFKVGPVWSLPVAVKGANWIKKILGSYIQQYGIGVIWVLGKLWFPLGIKR